jgi:hypothetical protein
MSIDYNKINLYRKLNDLSKLLINEKFGIEYQKYFEYLIIRIYFTESIDFTFKKKQHQKKIKINYDTFMKMNISKQYDFIKKRL